MTRQYLQSIENHLQRVLVVMEQKLNPLMYLRMLRDFGCIGNIGSLPVKTVALGSLIDLCETVQCVPYLITWRRNEQGIKALLMDIFRQENKQLVVKTDENEIILDYMYPLMGKNQFYETYCMCKKHVGNAAIGDMFISCRPKVYCLLEILTNRDCDTVEMANEVYNTYTEELSVKDEVTCLLAENFLALKLSEEWKEIEQEFKKINLEPTPSDNATLKVMVEIADKWGRDLQRMQREIFKKYQLRQRKKEENLYRVLREATLADAWDSLCEMKYIARCSERLFRVTSNFNLQSQISRSFKVDASNGQMHRTFQSNLSVTCMHNQSIAVPSEVYENSLTVNGGNAVMVSPISSSTASTPRLSDDPQGDYLPEKLLKSNESESQYGMNMKSEKFFNCSSNKQK